MILSYNSQPIRNGTAYSRRDTSKSKSRSRSPSAPRSRSAKRVTRSRSPQASTEMRTTRSRSVQRSDENTEVVGVVAVVAVTEEKQMEAVPGTDDATTLENIIKITVAAAAQKQSQSTDASDISVVPAGPRAESRSRSASPKGVADIDDARSRSPSCEPSRSR